MTDAFRVLAVYTTREGAAERVLGLLAELARASRTEPGNLSYEFFQGVEDENRIVIVEKYRSAEDFEAHRGSSHFAEIGAAQIVPLLESRDVLTWISGD